MSGPRRGDVPWRTAPTDRPFPAAGPDGTGSVGATDALRAPELGTDATSAARWDDGPWHDAAQAGGARTTTSRPGAPAHADPQDPLPAPRTAREDAPATELAALALPALPPLAATDDPASRAAVERWMDDDLAAHADGPPQTYRVLPTPPPPRPSLTERSPARQAPTDDLDAGEEPDDTDEDPQVRAWREEREFEAQFGQWRAGAAAPRPMRRSTLVSPPVLLLAFVLIVVLYYALTT